MTKRSVFFDEWLRSLREQYKEVVRNDDRVTLPTLTTVMQSVGFGDDELRSLRLEATMRADEVAEDFAPDMQILGASAAHPAECLCPECAPIDESQFDADGQPLVPDPDAAEQEDKRAFPAAVLAEPDDEPALTYADSLSQDEPADNATLEVAETAAEADPDAPQQKGLF